jgi:hypothetical protein
MITRRSVPRPMYIAGSFVGGCCVHKRYARGKSGEAWPKGHLEGV